MLSRKIFEILHTAIAILVLFEQFSGEACPRTILESFLLLKLDEIKLVEETTLEKWRKMVPPP